MFGPLPWEHLNVLVPGDAAEGFPNVGSLDRGEGAPRPEDLVLAAHLDVPAAHEAGDEQRDQEEAGEQDAKHQPEVALHALQK